MAGLARSIFANMLYGRASSLAPQIHSSQHILYVGRPVDTEYESLDVKIPVSIDGISVHAENAPVLFVVGVGGYMSASNYRQGGPGGLGGPGAPSGCSAGGALSALLGASGNSPL
jgi:hypothetical protein